jgi:hypothetical protein
VNVRIYAALTAAALMAVSPVRAVAADDKAPFDLVAGYHWLSPGTDDDWSDASGVEIQGRFWRDEHVGFALAGSFDTWEAKTEVYEEDTGSTYFYSSIMGDASVTSLGASLLYRSQPTEDIILGMNIGLRYAMVDSTIYAEAAYDGPGGPNYLYDKIEIENTLLLVIGGEMQFELSHDISLILGAGYQVDLNKPEETYAGSSLGETKFNAASFSILLACEF